MICLSKVVFRVLFWVSTRVFKVCSKDVLRKVRYIPDGPGENKRWRGCQHIPIILGAANACYYDRLSREQCRETYKVIIAGFPLPTNVSKFSSFRRVR